LEDIKKAVEETIQILEEVEKVREAAHRNATVFYTSLKQKDADRAFHRLIALKGAVNKAFEKFIDVLDDYEVRVLAMLEEQEDE
jgi:DNA-binding FadR family transcriptional regulator